jgi:hypothetical protein
MEAICSSETSVDTRRTTRQYIPEYGALIVTMKRTIFWVVMLCCSERAQNQQMLARLAPASAFLLLGLPSDPGDGGDMFL